MSAQDEYRTEFRIRWFDHGESDSISAPSADEARATGERLVPTKAGAAAYSVLRDQFGPRTITILGTWGEVPEWFRDDLMDTLMQANRRMPGPG